MMDGLGLAETTPGPLIMVLQFVGFVGGWQSPEGLAPFAAATLGAAITTWTTFVPCFLWIFLGAPHIEQMRDNKRLGAALGAVTAAVVGVILNLAIWFGLHVLFPETAGRLSAQVNWFAALVAVAAFMALQRCKVDVPWVIAGAAGAGLAWHFVGV
jgi:chromate transporter